MPNKHETLSEVAAPMQYLATLSTSDELYFVTLLKLYLRYVTSNIMSSVYSIVVSSCLFSGQLIFVRFTMKIRNNMLIKKGFSIYLAFRVVLPQYLAFGMLACRS